MGLAFTLRRNLALVKTLLFLFIIKEMAANSQILTCPKKSKRA